MVWSAHLAQQVIKFGHFEQVAWLIRTFDRALACADLYWERDDRSVRGVVATNVNVCLSFGWIGGCGCSLS